MTDPAAARRPLTVLVAHNRYRSAAPSGENLVVEDNVRRLREAGCEVVAFIRDSDDIARMTLPQKIGVGAGPVYSPSGVREFVAVVDRARPDVVHLHNPYPLLSPWIVRSAARRGIPVVQTVHNHRHTCIGGTHLRDGKDCYDCPRAGTPFPGVRHRCYRGSVTQSAAMAAGSVAHRRTWRLVARYLALNSSLRAELVSTGIDEDRISLLPNSVPDPGAVHPPGRDVLFVGRLDATKGVELLLDAWLRTAPGDARLVLAGDGPLRGAVERAAAASPGIEYRGLLDRNALDECYRQARFVVVPSVWAEPFPLVVVEALSHGRPVLVTRVGGLPEVVGADAGITSEVDAASLADGLTRLLVDDAAQRSAAARARYEGRFAPGIVTQQLLDIYRDVIDEDSAAAP